MGTRMSTGLPPPGRAEKDRGPCGFLLDPGLLQESVPTLNPTVQRRPLSISVPVAPGHSRPQPSTLAKSMKS